MGVKRVLQLDISDSDSEGNPMEGSQSVEM